MKHTKKLLSLLLVLCLILSLSCTAFAADEAKPLTGKTVILHSNDVHGAIDLYAAMASLKADYEAQGAEVILADAGDYSQGTVYVSVHKGADAVTMMNATGYDVATIGNHEFDYGMDRAKELMRDADFPYLSCNWVDLRTTLRVLPSVKVFVRGGRRIAFVGVTTPETFTKSTPAYFMDKAQRKYIYDIQGGEDGKKLYDAVQKAIDKAKLLADVVIGLGHLGVDPSSSPWTSEEVIAHTSGFDAFIDGHSHTVMENKQVQDASGKAELIAEQIWRLSVLAQRKFTADELKNFLAGSFDILTKL